MEMSQALKPIGNKSMLGGEEKNCLLVIFIYSWMDKDRWVDGWVETFPGWSLVLFQGWVMSMTCLRDWHQILKSFSPDQIFAFHSRLHG
jgi:hypothetical protein